MAVIAPIVTGLLTDPNETTPPTAAQSLTSSIGASSQDLAKQQGVAYEGLAKTAEGTTADFADYDSAGAVTEAAGVFQPAKATSYYDKALGTIAGQMESLYSADNPYIKNARTGAKEMAASRGALNTSMAAGQAERGAIEAGFKIAEGDANAYNKFALNQQASENQLGQIQVEGVVSGKLNQQTADIKQTSQNIQNAFQSRLQGADQQTKVFLQDFQQKHAAALQDLIGDQNAFLQSTQIAADKAQTVYAQAGEYVKNYQIAIENMMTDPDFLAMGQTAVNKSINELQTLTKNSIKFVGASAGLNMTSYSNLVNNYFSTLSFATK